MGNGGIYAKRKKQEKPKSPRERYEYESKSSGGSTKATQSNYEVDRYARKGSKQKGIDTSLATTGRKKWERRRSGNPKKGE